MADRDAFDPRYDPAFQRGYDWQAPSSRPRPVPGDPVPTVRSAPAPVQPLPVVAPTADPGRHSVVDHIAADETRADVSAVRLDAVHDAEASTGAAAGLPTGAREPWRNPFLLAVGALGVLCLLAGGIWIGRTRDFFDVGAQNEADFWLVMISLVGAPLLLTLGLAIVAGVLFFLARFWQRQPA